MKALLFMSREQLRRSKDGFAKNCGKIPTLWYKRRRKKTRRRSSTQFDEVRTHASGTFVPLSTSFHSICFLGRRPASRI
jgi:hypothetical protein